MKLSIPKLFAKTKRAAPKATVKAAPVVIRDPLPLPGNLLPRLNALRHRHKMVGVSTGISHLVAAISLLLLVQGVSDWWFDLPWLARAGFLLADIVILGVIYQRHLHAAMRRKLGLPETALLVEKKWPQLQQSVIAAVQLTEGKSYSTRGSPQLIAIMLEQARARTTSLNFSDVVPNPRAAPLADHLGHGGPRLGRHCRRGLAGEFAVARAHFPLQRAVADQDHRRPDHARSRHSHWR